MTTSRFQKTADTIIDTKTGLEWHQEVVGPMSWQEAMDYAKKRGKGWRLPTIEELITLIDFSRQNPATEFPGMPRVWVWSLSPYAYSSSYAWVVNFDSGFVDYYDKSDTSYARCVRGGRNLECWAGRPSYLQLLVRAEEAEAEVERLQGCNTLAQESWNRQVRQVECERDEAINAIGDLRKRLDRIRVADQRLAREIVAILAGGHESVADLADDVRAALEGWDD